MRNIYDQYAKDTLRALLTPVGPLDIEKEVRPEAQRVDLFFTPARDRIAKLTLLGLLGRLTRRPCSLEHFHNTPAGLIIIECLRKHLNLCHLLSLEPIPPPAMPLVWVLSSGRPDGALAGLGLTQGRGWPRGVYLAPSLLRLGVVAINELREERDTLLLRLLGSGRTLKRATAELRRLPPDALEVQVVLPILIRYHLEAATDPDRTSEDKEFLMSTQDVVAMWEQRVRQEGLDKGRQEMAVAARQALLVLYEVRFGLPAPEVVRARLNETSDPGVLGRWIELVGRAPRNEVDQVLGAG